MDALAKLQAVEDADTYDFTLRDPATNAPLMVLVLAGPTHEKMLAHKKRMDRNLSGAVKRTRDITKAITSQVTEVLDDEDVALAKELDRLMSGTLGWKDADGGESSAYDAKLMESMYRAKLWLRNVVGAELNRSENFTRSSASN